MNRLKTIFIMIIIIINGCEQKQLRNDYDNKAIDSISNYNFSVEEKIVDFSMENRKKYNLDSWNALNNFIDRFENLSKMIPEGNLVFIEELIMKTDELLKSNFPEKHNISDIKSRIKVVKSMLLKSRYNSKNQKWEELDISLNELFTAYNSLVNRIISVADENNIF
tara:strand:- start:7353 stop:7850 length:498 start_codon:yes stop_codon:yes gene_type:complete